MVDIMVDYRFYKLYQLFLQLESAALQDPDITHLKSGSDTRNDLIDVKNQLTKMMKSFDFIEKMSSSSGSMMDYKLQKDKKHFMDELYNFAMNTFSLLKHKRQNMQEEFIFRDIFNKIYDVSQLKINDPSTMMKVKEALDNILKEVNMHIGMFHRSFLSGDYTYQSPKYQKKLDW